MPMIIKTYYVEPSKQYGMGPGVIAEERGQMRCDVTVQVVSTPVSLPQVNFKVAVSDY